MSVTDDDKYQHGKDVMVGRKNVDDDKHDVKVDGEYAVRGKHREASGRRKWLWCCGGSAGSPSA